MPNTLFVVYARESTRIITGQNGKMYYSTEAAAKAHLTRSAKKWAFRPEELAISKLSDFHKVEKQVEKVNLMTGKKFTQSVNTPRSCDPSSELYWSM